MGLLNVNFPVGLSYGSGGGPGFDTVFIRRESGHVTKIRRRSSALRSYDVAQSVKSADDLRDVQEFFLAVGGGANTFRFKDWFDYTTGLRGVGSPTAFDVIIGVGDNIQTDFQLKKIYSEGAFSHTRKIVLPLASTVVASLDDVVTTDFTVNDVTGIITFGTAPGTNVVVKAGFEFDVPVFFAADVDRLLSLSMDDFEAGTIPDIPLEEDPDPSQESDQFFYGGAKNHGTVSSSITIAPAQGRVHVVAPDTSGLQVKLPLTTILPLGGPWFVVSNTGTESIDVAANDGTPVISVPVGFVAELHLGVDSSGDKTWVGK